VSDTSTGRSTAVRILAVDATTRDVLRAFQRADIRSVLLKGPALKRELYPDGPLRSYDDTDLLVPPGDLHRAEKLLPGMGFYLRMDQAAHPDRIPEPYAQVWTPVSNGPSVDIHWRLPGTEASGERTWEILTAETKPITIGGAAGEMLASSGIALLVGLHAGHHGADARKPVADLERALEVLGPDVWAKAAGLAGELDGVETFAAGLRLVPAGERIAAELELPTVRSALTRLNAATPPPAAVGLLGIVDPPAGRRRIRALRDAVGPSPDFMRSSFALARRGTIGLALAYVWRGFVRTGQLPAAIRAVRSSRRS
jgi:hypothetical protein